MAAIKQFLKRINSLPADISIRHYYPFGETAAGLKDEKLDSSESWDYLRTSHPDFSVSEDREEWLKASELEVRKDGQDGGLVKRARDAAETIDSLGIKSVFSVGVGGAGLEYQIKKIRPNVMLTCSEHSKANVGILRKVFLEADDVVEFDMTAEEWPAALRDPSALCLIYRIDASFTNAQWRRIFENIHGSGVRNVLYIPTNFLTILSMAQRMFRRFAWRLKGTRYSFAGHLRTKRSFQKFWDGLYDEEFREFGGLGGFILRRK